MNFLMSGRVHLTSRKGSRQKAAKVDNPLDVIGFFDFYLVMIPIADYLSARTSFLLDTDFIRINPGQEKR